MTSQITREYHGQTISFDERREEWKITMDGKEQCHKSLQIIKNYIDRRNKKEFKRVPVFVQEGNWYHSTRKYEKATITSVGVDETIFIVREGRKHAEHCGTAYLQNDKNKKLIEEIAALHGDRDRADEKLSAAREKLVEVNLDKLREEALRK